LAHPKSSPCKHADMRSFSEALIVWEQRLAHSAARNRTGGMSRAATHDTSTQLRCRSTSHQDDLPKTHRPAKHAHTLSPAPLPHTFMLTGSSSPAQYASVSFAAGTSAAAFS
jgi:hypothetical protein